MQAVHHYYIGCVYTSVRQGPQQRGTHPQLEFLGGLRFALPPYKFAATSFGWDAHMSLQNFCGHQPVPHI